MAETYVDDLRNWKENISDKGRKASFVSTNPRPRNWFDKVLKFFPGDPPGSNFPERVSKHRSNIPPAGDPRSSVSDNDAVVVQPKVEAPPQNAEAVMQGKATSVSDNDAVVAQPMVEAPSQNALSEQKQIEHRANQELLNLLPTDQPDLASARELLQSKIAAVNEAQLVGHADVPLADIASEVKIKDKKSEEHLGKVLNEIKTTTSANIEKLEGGVAKLQEILNTPQARKVLFTKDIPNTDPKLIEVAIEGLEGFLRLEKEMLAVLDVALPDTIQEGTVRPASAADVTNLGYVLSSSVFSEYMVSVQRLIQEISLVGAGALDPWAEASTKLSTNEDRSGLMANAIFILPTQRLMRWPMLTNEATRRLENQSESVGMSIMHHGERQTKSFVKVSDKTASWSTENHQNLLQMSQRDVGRMRPKLAFQAALDVAKNFQDSKEAIGNDPAERSFEEISRFSEEKIVARVIELAIQGRKEVARNVKKIRSEGHRKEHPKETQEFITNTLALADRMVAIGAAENKTAALQVLEAPTERLLNQWKTE